MSAVTADQVRAFLPTPVPLDTIRQVLESSGLAPQHLEGKLKQIAASGTYRDMAALADATPGFRSNNANMTHKDYWYLKMRSGDWPMAQADKLLGYRYAVADTSVGKVYIWPWMARLKPEQITPVAERDISRLLGETLPAPVLSLQQRQAVFQAGRARIAATRDLTSFSRATASWSSTS